MRVPLRVTKHSMVELYGTLNVCSFLGQAPAEDYA